MVFSQFQVALSLKLFSKKLSEEKFRISSTHLSVFSYFFIRSIIFTKISISDLLKASEGKKRVE